MLARALRRTVVVASCVVIVVSLAALAVFVFFPDVAEEYTAGLRPTQFYDPVPPDLITADLEREYEQIFGMAHNFDLKESSPRRTRRRSVSSPPARRRCCASTASAIASSWPRCRPMRSWSR